MTFSEFRQFEPLNRPFVNEAHCMKSRAKDLKKNLSSFMRVARVFPSLRRAS